MVGVQERRRGGGHDGVQRVAVGVVRVERRKAPAKPVHESRHYEGSQGKFFFQLLFTYTSGQTASILGRHIPDPTH